MSNRSIDTLLEGDNGSLQPATGVPGAPVRFDRRLAPWLLLVHIIAALALFPWFFSWTGVVLAVAGLFVFGTIGINVGYHRLLTHRSFACPRWMEYTLAFIGVCALQDAPAYWAAIHRRHHQFSDDEHDPHSPVVSLFWAHVGWLIKKPEDMKRRPLTEQYAKDLMRQPYYAWFERGEHWFLVPIASWLVYFGAGYAIVRLSGGSTGDAIQFGSSLLVWGAALRTVAVWHLTWAVNSVTHVWGYRNYATPDRSRNNALIALISSGEGWHNNHHADPRSARHGHKWWEFDLTWLVIRLLMACGLATNVALPSPLLAAKFNGEGPDVPARDHGNDDCTALPPGTDESAEDKSKRPVP
jgi:stearoyl-CoA desaturase (delta-9 desaturase)